MTSAKDILVAAKALIEEKGWAQGYFAYDQYRDKVSPWQYNAESFCTVGALIRVSGALRYAAAHSEETKDLSASEKMALIDAVDRNASLAKCAVIKAIGPGTIAIPTWNDDPIRTKQDVLDVFDLAILDATEDVAK